MQINIDDSKINNYSSSAKEELEKQILNYADIIIKESELIEYASREENTTSEVTSTIVATAAKKRNMKVTKKEDKKKIIAIKILSWVSMLFVGLLFDIEQCQNNTLQFLALIVVLIFAAVFSILQIFWEELK